MLNQLPHVNLRCVLNIYLSDSESNFVQIATHNSKDGVEAKYSQVFLIKPGVIFLYKESILYPSEFL